MDSLLNVSNECTGESEGTDEGESERLRLCLLAFVLGEAFGRPLRGVALFVLSGLLCGRSRAFSGSTVAVGGTKMACVVVNGSSSVSSSCSMSHHASDGITLTGSGNNVALLLSSLSRFLLLTFFLLLLAFGFSALLLLLPFCLLLALLLAVFLLLGFGSGESGRVRIAAVTCGGGARITREAAFEHSGQSQRALFKRLRARVGDSPRSALMRAYELLMHFAHQPCAQPLYIQNCT